MESKKVLVVDLDNSLLKIDLFKESLGKSLLKRPLVFFKTVMLALNSIALAKTFISKECKTDCHTLPYNNKILDIIDSYRKKGYLILLATGAPQAYAHSIANHLGLFDEVIATNEQINNVGINKLESIKKHVNDSFIYLNDSVKDLPVWLHCKKAILIGDNGRVKNMLIKNNVEIIDTVKKEKSIIEILLKQLRVHQWSKNMLLFVPALLSHQLLEPGVFLNALCSFIAFSLLASSIYVLNDIIDVDYDRKHPMKKNRPIAAGDLSMLRAYAVLLVCFLIGGWMAMLLGTTFLFVMAVYIILNLLYSLYFKRIIILDVLLLMSFYTLRIIAGHIPDTFPFSPWLLSFSVFLFFSLAFLKRYVNIILENNVSTKNGTGYSINDSNILKSFGVGSGIISTLVLILYTGSEQVQPFYLTPMILIFLAPIMLYWICRIWLLADRGLIKDDPILFAIKDKISYVVAICFLCIMFFSKYVLL